MKVSVCMGVYNGERFLAEQLASILHQLGAGDEVIISDNLSTDGTRERIEHFHDSRVEVVNNPTFTNLIFNFENALKRSSGDIIFLADADDVWLPNKVQIMKPLLENYDVVNHDCEVVDANGEVLVESFFSLRGSGPGLMRNLIRNTYVGCCMGFRREILNIALPFPKNIPMHDGWIAGLGDLLGTTYFCPEKLIKYRRHGSNMSATAGKSPYSLTRKIGFRVNLLAALLIRTMQHKLSRTAGRRGN